MRPILDPAGAGTVPPTLVGADTETITTTFTTDDVEAFYDQADLWAVIVWNDDVNTFDHVIRALVEIMHHSLERAEQLTMKVHTTGQAVVGIRPHDEAERAVAAIRRRGIAATMDRA
jgi:ATP-dependent Clp protease adaptor protein ClpS